MEIFQDSEDCQYFMNLLSEYSKRFLLKVYHWVIMLNHYHLLLEIDEPKKISSIMAGIGRAYVHYHHKKYMVFGYLWQGRFKSQPIERELYLAACGRYIERNPVKANIVGHAWGYPYSSARYYVLGEQDNLTEENPLFLNFGNDVVSRREKYKEYLESFNAEEEMLFENLELPRGSKEFLKKLIKGRGHYFPRRQGRIMK